MEFKILSDSNIIINKIAHIADIHVRNTTRHDEYRIIFNKLYEQLKEQNVDLIVLAGDLFHSKTQISPESIDMIFDLLYNLEKIAPVIVIPGNHDINITNLERSDGLSSIKNIAETLHTLKNVHYIKEKGIYRYNNIDFYHFSIVENDNKKLFKFTIKSKKQINIGLYHAPVSTASTDTKWKVDSDVSVLHFTSLDAVMLGDIHKLQQLQKHSIENVLDENNKSANIIYPEIWYPGSLICQNYGESPQKGYLLWNIEDKNNIQSPEFIELKNDYTFYSLKVFNNKFDISLDTIKEKYPRFRLFFDDISYRNAQKFNNELNLKFTPTEITTNLISNVNHTNMEEFESFKELDILNINTQNKLIKDYVNRNYNFDENYINNILNINKKADDELRSNNVYLFEKNQKSNVNIEKIEYSNFLSYGKNNIFEFKNIKGVVGIIGNNRVGKTSLIDLIIYSLFGSTNKPINNIKIINNKKNFMETTIYFSINNVKYKIYRSLKKHKRNPNLQPTSVVEFYQFNNESNEWINITGKDINDTKQLIYSLLGTKEDILKTNILSQNSWQSFIYSRDKDRKNNLSEFLGIDILDKKYSIIKQKLNQKEAEINVYKKKNFNARLTEFNDYIRQTNISLKEEKEKLKLLNVKLKEEKKLLKLCKKDIDKINITIDFDPEEVKLKLTELVSKKEKIQNNINKIQNDINVFKSKLEDINKILVDEEKIKQQYSNFINKVELSNNIKNKAKLYKSTIESKLHNIKILEEEPWHETEELCKKCSFMLTAWKHKKEIEDIKIEISKLSNSYESITKYINENENITKLYKKIINLSDEKNKINDKLKTLNLNLKYEISSLESVDEFIMINENKILLYENNQLKFDEKNILLEKEKNIQNNIDNINDDILKTKENILKNEVNLKHYKKLIDELNEDWDKYNALIEETEYYKIYIDIMHRNNLPTDIINSALPLINSYINKLLKNIADFMLDVKLDDDKIKVNIIYNDDDIYPIEACSGMESIISELAIRSALIQVSNKTNYNFIVIDEGFSTLDSNMFPNLENVFNILKRTIDHVLIVSHIETMKDMVDKTIEITMENNYSKINL